MVDDYGEWLWTVGWRPHHVHPRCPLYIIRLLFSSFLAPHLKKPHLTLAQLFAPWCQLFRLSHGFILDSDVSIWIQASFTYLTILMPLLLPPICFNVPSATNWPAEHCVSVRIMSARIALLARFITEEWAQQSTLRYWSDGSFLHFPPAHEIIHDFQIQLSFNYLKHEDQIRKLQSTKTLSTKICTHTL